MLIRPAEPADYLLLGDIEARADVVYEGLADFDALDDMDGIMPANKEGLAASARVLVAAENGALLGFCYDYDLDDCAFIGQISVVPEAQGRGIGSQLLEATCAAAQRLGKRGVTLTTYDHLAWNRPYYAKRNFVVLDRQALSPQLAKEAADDALKWGKFGPRVVMGRFFV